MIFSLLRQYPNDFWHKRKIYNFDPNNVFFGSSYEYTRATVVQGLTNTHIHIVCTSICLCLCLSHTQGIVISSALTAVQHRYVPHTAGSRFSNGAEAQRRFFSSTRLFRYRFFSRSSFSCWKPRLRLMRDVAVQNGVKGQKRVAPSLWTAGIKARDRRARDCRPLCSGTGVM